MFRRTPFAAALAAAALLVTAAVATAATRSASAPSYGPDAASTPTRATMMGSVGWNDGPGGTASITWSDFADRLPVSLRLGVGYGGADPGDPWMARRVFINAADNGTASANGRRWDYRLDAVWPVHWFHSEGLNLLAGPRVSRYSAQYNFIGGNEFFNVVTTQWGLGTGLEKSYAMGPRMTFVAGAGLDWYFNAKMEGHDTAYSPDGTTVNPIDDYTWTDADKAVSQPRLSPRVMLGIQRQIGH